jgi:hypothetical protein
MVCIYINLNTAQDSAALLLLFALPNLMDFLCLSPFTYFTACLYDFFKPLKPTQHIFHVKRGKNFVLYGALKHSELKG